MKHAGGRPTDYSEDMLAKADKYLAIAIPENQDLPTVEGLALYLGVHKDTLYEWAKIHPEFSDALKKLKLKQKSDLIKIGIFGGKEINAGIVALMLKVNHDMVETNKTDITTAGEKLQANTIVFSDFKDATNSK